MRWIVHIGAPKTGSTAIQRFLFEARAQLPAQGVLYPDVSLRGFGHHDLAFLLAGGYPDWATPQDKLLAVLRDELRTCLAANTAPTVVLSSENFYLFPRPAALRDFLRDAGMAATDAIAIVAYLRRQDEAHVSWYNQTVKAQGNAASFEATVARTRGLWDYAEQLEPWRAIFGTDAIILRDYSVPTDVRTDFLHLIGIPDGAFALPPERVNERINRDILDFPRLLNRLPLKIQQKRRYHKRLIALTAETAGQGILDDAPLLSAALRDELIQYYAASNASVAHRFLGRDTLFEPGGAVQADERHHPLTLAKALFILRKMLQP